MVFFSGSDKDKERLEEAASKPTNPLASVFIDPAVISDITEKATSSFNKVFNNETFNDAFDQLSQLDKWYAGSDKPGLKAYPFPSVEKYDKCVENSGVSVWDENGWWRCLFPNSTARVGELSLEDIQNDKENKNGLFFKDYNQLLSWRSHLKKLAREKQELKQAESIQSIYDDYSKDVDFPEGDSGVQDVVRTSKSVYFRTLPNGDSEEITKIKNVFKDGKKQSEEIKRIFPKDGGEPIVERSDGGSKSWIWNRGK